MNILAKAFIASFASIAIASAAPVGEVSVSGNYQNNRQPLLQKTYIELPLGAIKAEGWMQEQLVRMKNRPSGRSL